MRKKLTTVGIKALPEGTYADIGCPGLSLRIGRNRRTWSVWHRLGGRLKLTLIGHFPAMSLAAARQAAAELAERVNAGVAPQLSKPHPSAAMTLGQLVDAYEKHRRRKGGRIKSLDQSLRVVRSGLAGYLGMPAAAFSKADLRAARDTIAGRGAMIAANRFQAYLSAILRWAEAEDMVPHAVRVLRVGNEIKRTRTLTPDELRRIWHACDRLGRADAGGRLVRFLLLVGCRRSEAANMRHGDLLGGIWRQPAETTKSGREQRLRLPDLALAQLGAGSADQFCFAGADGGAYRSFLWLKRHLDELSGVGGWRLHDLRRTAASGWQDLGVDFMTIEGLLNHQVAGVAGHYLHGELAASKATALARWAEQVERLVGARQAAL